MRILVDRSVVELFAQRGRASMIDRVYPKNNENGPGIALVYTPSPGSTATDAPVVDMAVWSMSNGTIFQ
jgi:sucrose-6-phosphate hydrolase SacC (GH32 family)